MPSEKPKFYVTTPIYYVNARPHIGHAYTTIVADVLARRHRLLGEETFFLTGTDEHGQKIERSAAAAGIRPQQFTDQVAAEFKTLWDRMGITYDKFIRTTDPAHQRGVQQLFRTLQEKGFIEMRSYTGTYCVSDETFVDVKAGEPCPDCGRITETVTEDNYFFMLSKFQLPLLNLIESGELKIENEARRNEVLSFLRGDLVEVHHISTAIAESLPHIPSKSAKQFLARIQEKASSHPDILKLEKEGKLARSDSGELYVPGALKDLSISRSSFKWGIPVPGDPKHVIYVWLDALTNYITALGYGSDDTSNFEKFWQTNGNGSPLHLVGKEIIRFHCVYWPAFLLAADLPLPKAITAHGWLLFDNSKMSKSKGNIVRTETILDAFGTLCPLVVDDGNVREPMKQEKDLFASDVLRYFLLREIPFGQDGGFSFDALWARYDSDLGSKYGNLVNRSLTMINNFFDGNIPTIYELPVAMGNEEIEFLQNHSSDLAHKVDLLRVNISYFFDRREFASMLQSIWEIIAATDTYITLTAPWRLPPVVRDQIEPTLHDRRSHILAHCYESIRIVTALLHPILPYATTRVWQQLGLDPAELTTHNLELTTWGGLRPGTRLGPLSPIFPRADKSLIEIMTNMEEQNAPAAVQPTTEAQATPQPPVPVTAPLTTDNLELTTPSITIDDFAKIELRVAQVVVAERIPKADKLLRLEVDLGPDFPRRQILSGIAEHYTPEELIGRRIVVITNLAPRKMRGLESHGMLLAASHGENGKPILATFAEDIALGSRLK